MRITARKAEVQRITSGPQIVMLIAIGFALARCGAARASLNELQSANSLATVPAVKPEEYSRAADALAKIQADDYPTHGSERAEVTMFVFEDFQCPFCAQVHRVLEEALEKYRNRVRLVVVPVPNARIHRWAMHAAIDGSCLASQNRDAYWDFSHYVYSHQAELNAATGTGAPFSLLDDAAEQIGRERQVSSPKMHACIVRQVETPIRRARREAVETLGIEGVPALLIGGDKFEGVISSQQLTEILEHALRPPDRNTPPFDP